MLRRKEGQPILGIDVGTAAITMVEMRGTWPSPHVVSAESVPTPPGAVEPGGVVNIDAVAGVVNALLERAGTKTRDAVMSIAAGDNLTTRIIDVPAVPADEMGPMVEGEIEHQRILRSPLGTFDYVQLQTPGGGAQSGIRVLVMAAEEHAVTAQKAIAERVGLHLVALEPALCAMHRPVADRVYGRQSALCLAIGQSESEIAIVDRGNIRLYRRIDAGSEQLIKKGPAPGLDAFAPRSNPLGKPAFLLSDDEEEELDDDLASTTSGMSGPIDVAAANGLAVEIQRSLDYYRREYPDEGEAQNFCIVATDPGLYHLAEWLSQNYRADVSLARVPFGPDTNIDIQTRLESADGMRYLAAAGMAMRTLGNLPAGVPCFDLRAQRRTNKQEVVQQRRFMVSIAVTAAILIFGIGATVGKAIAGNGVSRDLDRSKSELFELQKRKSWRIDQIQRQKDLMAILKLEGLPIPRLTDAVASTVPPRVGLTDITINKSGTMAINGEASDDKVIIALLEGLKSGGLMQNTSLDSFDSSSPDNRKTLVHFAISSQIIGVKHPKPIAPPPDPNKSDEN